MYSESYDRPRSTGRGFGGGGSGFGRGRGYQDDRGYNNRSYNNSGFDDRGGRGGRGRGYTNDSYNSGGYDSGRGGRNTGRGRGYWGNSRGWSLLHVSRTSCVEQRVATSPVLCMHYPQAPSPHTHAVRAHAHHTLNSTRWTWSRPRPWKLPRPS